MIPRLHVDAPLSENAEAPLAPGQAHYLTHVLRLKPGQSFLVFNARDGEFEAALVEGKKGAHGSLGRRVRPPRSDPADLWVLFAAVKRAAVETIVQKGTELGVGRFIPVFTERTQRERINLDRLGAVAIEAAEQCLRLDIPPIAPGTPLTTALSGWNAGRRLYFCDEAGDEAGELWGGRTGRAAPMLDALATEPAGPAAILIGPEGGFSRAERDALRALPFVLPVSLGPRILRADTAALAAVTLWQARRGDLNQS